MSVYYSDREVIAAREEIVRRVGLGDVWDRLHADDEDTPTRHLLLSVVSTLALYMDESDLHLAHSP